MLLYKLIKTLCMIPDTIRFSVIIPTYNRADLLEKCLSSLTQQSYKNFEVIVCDDGSSDNSRQVVKSYEGKLNVKYFYEQNWGGPARPRNNGLRAASGEWVAFLDSDDSWGKRKLEIVSKYLDRADLIYHRMIVRNEHNHAIAALNSKDLALPVFNNLLVAGNRIPLSSVICRKSKILEVGGFTEDRRLISLEDFDLWLKLSKGGARFYFVPEFLGYYYSGGDNISQASMEQVIKLRAIYLKYLPFIFNRVERRNVLGSFYYQKYRMLCRVNKSTRHQFDFKRAFFLSNFVGKLKVSVVFIIEVLNLIKFYRKVLLFFSSKGRD